MMSRSIDSIRNESVYYEVQQVKQVLEGDIAKITWVNARYHKMCSIILHILTPHSMLYDFYNAS